MEVFENDQFSPFSLNRLTAFVAKVFCQATEFFHVDPTVTCDAIRWLLRQVQRPNDGAFFEPYRVHHREMTVSV